MASFDVQRKLTAILCADVVGYSRLMGENEKATLRTLIEYRQVFSDHIEKFRGRIVNAPGDSILAEFSSVVDAVEGAAEIQRELAERNAELLEARRMLFRIGINLGDVLVKSEELYGDGVNIAARLESLAESGGICISRPVFDQVKQKLKLHFVYMGEQQVKNIAEPVRAYQVLTKPGDAAHRVVMARQGVGGPETEKTRSPGKKPALALLPFEAMDQNEETRALMSATAEAVSSSLANLTGLSVVTTPDAADYTAKASIQTTGGRFRATVQLFDRQLHKQFWSGRFDGALGDRFKTLDDLAFLIGSVLRFETLDWDNKKSLDRPIDQMSNEDLIAQAGQLLMGSKRLDWEKTGDLMEKVIERNPDNFMALALRACSYYAEPVCGYKEIRKEDGRIGIQLARRALEINERSDFAHLVLGWFHFFFEKDIDATIREAERSLEINPYYTIAMGQLGAAKIYGGDPEAGLALCLRANEVDTRFTANHRFMFFIANAHFVLENYDAASDWARRADQRHRDIPRYILLLITAFLNSGQLDASLQESERLMAIFPDFRIREMDKWPFRYPEPWDRMVHGLREAGLPE